MLNRPGTPGFRYPRHKKNARPRWLLYTHENDSHVGMATTYTPAQEKMPNRPRGTMAGRRSSQES